MRKKIIGIIIITILLIAFCGCTNKNNATVAGTYEMIDVEGMEYNDFIYCNLTLDEKGEYSLSYQKKDFDKFDEIGKFDVKESKITFFTGSISGGYEIESKRFKLTLKLSQKSVTALFVLTKLPS